MSKPTPAQLRALRHLAIRPRRGFKGWRTPMCPRQDVAMRLASAGLAEWFQPHALGWYGPALRITNAGRVAITDRWV
jgi:hypothetical protein